MRRILLVVSGVALLECLGLLISIPLWVRIALGAVLLVAGITWALIVSKRDRPGDAVDDTHADQLRTLLGTAGTTVASGRTLNIADSDAGVFSKHFPQLNRQLAEWDQKVDQVEGAKRALRESVEKELHKLGADKPPYEFDTLINGLCVITETRSSKGLSADPLPPIVGSQTGSPIFIYIPVGSPRLVFSSTPGAQGCVIAFDGVPPPAGNPYTAIMGYARPIYDFLREMQTWNPTKNLIQKRNDLVAFPKSTLESHIQNAQDEPHIKQAKGCPGCD